MPRILTGAGIVVTLLAPAFALAAFNDVTLTTDTVLSVNGVTLNVSGSSATIESITVNATNFSVTLASGSFFQVSAPGLEQLSTNSLTGVSSNLCNTAQSLLAYQPSTSVTVTITPMTTSCASASTGGGSSSGGGGGGGSSTTASTASVASVVTSTTVATSTTATTSVAAVTLATPTTPATPATPASGLTSGQATAILSLLSSFGADSATIEKVRAVLFGTASAGAPSVNSSFTRDLEAGIVGDDVKALQVFLNTNGYIVAKSGAGSLGNETTRFGPATKAALVKFQKAKGIVPAAGYFGPKTRAAVKAGS